MPSCAKLDLRKKAMAGTTLNKKTYSSETWQPCQGLFNMEGNSSVMCSSPNMSSPIFSYIFCKTFLQLKKTFFLVKIKIKSFFFCFSKILLGWRSALSKLSEMRFFLFFQILEKDFGPKKPFWSCRRRHLVKLTF